MYNKPAVTGYGNRVTHVLGDTCCTADDSAVVPRILGAAMRCFAGYGVEAGSLRMVAEAAGVSVGYIQHQFGTKAALVDAVNDRLGAILAGATSLPIPGPDPVAEVTRRVIALVEKQPEAIDYLGRLLLNDYPAGRAIFDELVAVGTAQWDHIRAGQTRCAETDPVWDTLSPLIQVLSVLVLRSHIERQVLEPLTSPDPQRGWESAIRRLVDVGVGVGVGVDQR
jgi:TetR/AcrR family transcriptional regulator, regulator of cefoperazone and chloramphenicol sensitivity